MVWRYACGFFRILNLFFITGFLLQYLGKWYRTNGPLVNLPIFNTSNKNKAGDINSPWNLLVFKKLSNWLNSTVARWILGVPPLCASKCSGVKTCQTSRPHITSGWRKCVLLMLKKIFLWINNSIKWLINKRLLLLNTTAVALLKYWTAT